MNNTQLYLTTGVASFLALISWVTVILAWSSNKTDIKEFETCLYSKIDKVDSRNDLLRAEINGLRKGIYEGLIPLHERMARRGPRKYRRKDSNHI